MGRRMGRKKRNSVGIREFNRTAKEVNGNNNNTDKKNIQTPETQGNTQSNSHHLMPHVPPSCY